MEAMQFCFDRKRLDDYLDTKARRSEQTGNIEEWRTGQGEKDSEPTPERR